MSLKSVIGVLGLIRLFVISSCSQDDDRKPSLLEETSPSIQSALEPGKGRSLQQVQRAESVLAQEPDKSQNLILSAADDSVGDRVGADDFNNGSKPNCLRGDLSAFAYMPDDFSQSCTEPYDWDVERGDLGFSRYLDYVLTQRIRLSAVFGQS